MYFESHIRNNEEARKGVTYIDMENKQSPDSWITDI